MGKFQTNRIDFAGITTPFFPPVGEFIIGLDLADDVYKKMDSNGVLTVIGGSPGGFYTESNDEFKLDSHSGGTTTINSSGTPLLVMIQASNYGQSYPLQIGSTGRACSNGNQSCMYITNQVDSPSSMSLSFAAMCQKDASNYWQLTINNWTSSSFDAVFLKYGSPTSAQFNFDIWGIL